VAFGASATHPSPGLRSPHWLHATMLKCRLPISLRPPNTEGCVQPSPSRGSSSGIMAELALWPVVESPATNRNYLVMRDQIWCRDWRSKYRAEVAPWRQASSCQASRMYRVARSLWLNFSLLLRITGRCGSERSRNSEEDALDNEVARSLTSRRPWLVCIDSH